MDSAPEDPIVARVGAETLRLSAFFVAQILAETDPTKLLEESFFQYGLDSPLREFITAWLEQTAIRQGLPYNGAGTEFGLEPEPYLAARVKVSEAQLLSSVTSG